MAFFSAWDVTSILITPEETQNWQTFGVCCTRPESAECYRKATHTQNFARLCHRLKKLRSAKPGFSFQPKIAQSRTITRTINFLSRTICLQKSTQFSFMQVLNNTFHWKTNLHCVNYYNYCITLGTRGFFFFRRGGEQELQRGERNMVTSGQTNHQPHFHAMFKIWIWFCYAINFG